jgi:hypothetical protein
MGRCMHWECWYTLGAPHITNTVFSSITAVRFFI